MELSKDGQSNLRAFLVQVYGPRANSWAMTPRVADLTFNMLEKSTADDDLTNRIRARLAPGQAPSRWLSPHAVDVVLRQLARRKHHYAAAAKTAAHEMKAAFYRKAQAG